MQLRGVARAKLALVNTNHVRHVSLCIRVAIMPPKHRITSKGTPIVSSDEEDEQPDHIVLGGAAQVNQKQQQTKKISQKKPKTKEYPNTASPLTTTDLYVNEYAV